MARPAEVTTSEFRANDPAAGVEDGGGECAAWLFAVEAMMDFCPQLFGFGGTISVRHAPGHARQFFAGQLAFPRQFKSKLDDA